MITWNRKFVAPVMIALNPAYETGMMWLVDKETTNPAYQMVTLNS